MVRTFPKGQSILVAVKVSPDSYSGELVSLSTRWLIIRRHHDPYQDVWT